MIMFCCFQSYSRRFAIRFPLVFATVCPQRQRIVGRYRSFVRESPSYVSLILYVVWLCFHIIGNAPCNPLRPIRRPVIRRLVMRIPAMHCTDEDVSAACVPQLLRWQCCCGSVWAHRLRERRWGDPKNEGKTKEPENPEHHETHGNHEARNKMTLTLPPQRRGRKNFGGDQSCPSSLIFVESPDPCPEQIHFYFPSFF